MTIRICSRCINDEMYPGILFNDKGQCNYCLEIDELKIKYGTGKTEGYNLLNNLVEEIKKGGRNKKYDCVIGVSGGTDSSFLLLKAIEWGLRPLAVHYDNTWNNAIATENIRKITTKLKVDLFTHVVNNKEADDIFRSFFLAGVPEFDASTDLGLAQTIRMAAAKYGIKYILEGHSFTTEGISPQGKNYFDGKYISDIHEKYGKHKLKTYPLMTLYQFLKWTVIYKQKFIRPLWYIAYDKETARKKLIEELDWKYYDGHHLENRASAFVHKIYHPQKFKLDNRNWTLSADVREGRLSREEGLKIYNTPISADYRLIEYVKKRLNLKDDEYEKIMQSPPLYFTNFKTYKKTFELLRPLFFILAKRDIVPMSFYLKYCFPNKTKI